MPRTATVQDAFTLVNSLYKQATGETNIVATDTATYAAVAQNLTSLTNNQIYGALTEVFSGIRFAVRPIDQSMKMLWEDVNKFGAYLIKISFLDHNADAVDTSANGEENAYSLHDGDVLNVHTVKLPKAFEARIYGDNVIMAYCTISIESLRTALPSAASVASWLSALMVNLRNQVNRQMDTFARTALLNFIGGKIASEAANVPGTHVFHALTAYNTDRNTNYTNIAQVKAEGAYIDFIEFLFARVSEFASYMAEPSYEYHSNPSTKQGGGYLERHTPADRMKMFVLSKYLADVATGVRANIYNDEFLKLMKHDELSFWQSRTDRDSISVTASYMLTDGNIATSAVTKSNIFGVMFDEDAIMCGIKRQNEGDTPYDVQRDAYNKIFHMITQSVNDFTENGLVIILD